MINRSCPCQRKRNSKNRQRRATVSLDSFRFPFKPWAPHESHASWTRRTCISNTTVEQHIVMDLEGIPFQDVPCRTKTKNKEWNEDPRMGFWQRNHSNELVSNCYLQISLSSSSTRDLFLSCIFDWQDNENRSLLPFESVEMFETSSFWTWIKHANLKLYLIPRREHANKREFSPLFVSVLFLTKEKQEFEWTMIFESFSTQFLYWFFCMK